MAKFTLLPDFTVDSTVWIEGKKLWGKHLSQAIRAYLKQKAAADRVKPGLAVILVGEDPASEIYVASKEKEALECGFESRVIRLGANTQQETIIGHIHQLNLDPTIHATLVQLPLPKHLNEQTILQAILPSKDADGFHYENQGKLFSGVETTLPCTPAGISVMLTLLGDDFSGKKAVVLGRSNIVGKPMALLLLQQHDLTVTVCHSKSKNLREEIRSADILVSATGVRGLVNPDDIKDDAIVFDVGMHRIDGKLKGDLDLEKAYDRLRYYTPVPGGVGKMTIAMLLANAVTNALSQNQLLANQ